MITMPSIRRILVVAALAATALLSPAMHAQIPDGMQVKVPFAFNFGAQHFAPGTYSVSMLYDNVLRVSNNAKSGLAAVHSGTNSRGTNANYLIFRKYGDRYFLAEYHPFHSATLVRIPESQTERSVAREFAQNKSGVGGVRLALLENGNIASSNW
ncbi:MAG TPA: hypothetical protein VGS10_04935 [Terracidiphilus sp.]|nr:hypothetical protein [Terracidiphilus sp.]